METEAETANGLGDDERRGASDRDEASRQNKCNDGEDSTSSEAGGLVQGRSISRDCVFDRASGLDGRRNCHNKACIIQSSSFSWCKNLRTYVLHKKKKKGCDQKE